MPQVLIPVMRSIADHLHLFANNAPQPLTKPSKAKYRCTLFGSKIRKYGIENVVKRAQETYAKVTTAIKASVNHVLDKKAKLELKHAKKVHDKVRPRHLPHPRFFRLEV